MKNFLSLALMAFSRFVERGKFFSHCGTLFLNRVSQTFSLFRLAFDTSQILDCLPRRILHRLQSQINDLVGNAKTPRNLEPGRRTGNAHNQAVSWLQSLFVKLDTRVEHARL